MNKDFETASVYAGKRFSALCEEMIQDGVTPGAMLLGLVKVLAFHIAYQEDHLEVLRMAKNELENMTHEGRAFIERTIPKV